MLLVFGSLFFVRLLTISNALLLLFLLMLSSVSLHCSSIQFSLAFFRPLFIALLISLYVVAPSVVVLSFFSYLRLSHIFSKSPVTQGFFFWRCFPRILLAVSVTAVLKLFFIVSTSSSAKISGANFPPIIALNSSVMLGFFQIKLYPGILQSPNLLQPKSKIIIIMSWSLPTSAPGKLHVCALFMLDQNLF